MSNFYSNYLKDLQELVKEVEKFHSSYCKEENKRMQHKNTHLIKAVNKEIKKYEKHIK